MYPLDVAVEILLVAGWLWLGFSSAKGTKVIAGVVPDTEKNVVTPTYISSFFSYCLHNAGGIEAMEKHSRCLEEIYEQGEKWIF